MAFTQQDTLAVFTAGDMVLVKDGGRFSGCRGQVVRVLVLVASTVFLVALADDASIQSFEEWQLGYWFPGHVPVLDEKIPECSLP